LAIEKLVNLALTRREAKFKSDKDLIDTFHCLTRLDTQQVMCEEFKRRLNEEDNSDNLNSKNQPTAIEKKSSRAARPDPITINTKLSQTCRSRVKMTDQIKKTSLLVTLFLVLICLTISHQPADAAGKKLKKAAKEIAKGIIYSKLTSRKHFLPVPLPIPGKWQQVANLVADSTGGALMAAIAASSNGGTKKFGQKYSGGSSRKYVAGSGDTGTTTTTAKGLMGLNSKRFDVRKSLAVISGGQDSAGKKLLLFSASNLVNTLANVDSATGGKLSDFAKVLGAGNLKPLLASPNNQASSGAMDMKNVKKLTRLAAATYAKRIISEEAEKIHKRPTRSSGIANKLTNKGHSATESSENKNKRNDVLVTAFNVVKFAQQFRELDPRKILNLYKKSSISPSSTADRVPIVSMNINNRKTFLNKMHYIHKLTADLHHRHRNSNRSMTTNAN